MEVIFRPDAEKQLSEAISWFKATGQGQAFFDAIDELLEQIREFPRMHQIVHADVRRALLRRFPYAVFYLVEPTRVVILGVLHQSRDPARWPS